MSRKTTTEEPIRSRLGRGLAALIGDVGEEFGGTGERPAPGTRRVPIEFLRRNPHNPRTHFDETELAELAESVRERGIIQPIVVRAVLNLPDVYEIIAGERRWRAAQRAELHDVPVVVVEADDKLALELAIIENVQRADLNPLDEASGYERLIDQHGYSQSDLAGTLGKSRSHVANTLRLLKLSPHIRGLIEQGKISAGHGRALLAVEDADTVADRIVERGLTVRDIERLGRDEAEEAVDGDQAKAKAGRPRRQRTVDSDTRALEREIEDALGLSVQIDHRGPGGDVRLRYTSLEQLDALAARLRG
ncbi:ParB/RepB/Spo0J family partition protein [Enterovirga rhinocerotis]|uniref:ParB family chromosome partitioning protein n=1 Tax=Enterovirga rhinocerotis TaxID=1339210 RepID=A0A4R7BNL0_9HYPH|nr:ParB/RepB/Spo0J family partition protein [Enterovirga rhinocerotis]TDR87120.1 ParB family chromosome partitioning protein [Enterovirga rhinocerotis]